jgi:serine/threonine protein kinase
MRTQTAVITEHYPNGTLESAVTLLRAGKPPVGFGPTELSKCIFGIAFVMTQFHSRYRVHRSLRPKKIFLDSNFEPVIGGFGTLRLEDYDINDRQPVESLLFMPPELFADESSFDSSVDVFAFAVLICTLFEPPKQLDDGKTFGNSFIFMMRISNDARLCRPKGISDALWQFVTECWIAEPENRPTFAEIVARLKRSMNWTFPGTDLKALNEFHDRITQEHVPEPRPRTMIDSICNLLEWDDIRQEIE